MSKLSVVQIEVLGHMAQGHEIRRSGPGTPYLDGVQPDRYEVSKHVHSNTLYALLNKDCVEKVNTDRTPWYRRDYAITDKGRELLQQAREESND